MPVVSLEAPAPDSSQFSWKDYYRRALVALEEQLIDRKLTHAAHTSFRGALGRELSDPRVPGIELRLALESGLIHRQPKGVLHRRGPTLGQDEKRPQAAGPARFDQVPGQPHQYGSCPRRNLRVIALPQPQHTIEPAEHRYPLSSIPRQEKRIIRPFGTLSSLSSGTCRCQARRIFYLTSSIAMSVRSAVSGSSKTG
jgi:hypothetical protein